MSAIEVVGYPDVEHGVGTRVARVGIDAPDTRCAFDAPLCRVMLGAGGFDEHHPWPLSMGGPQVQQFLILCPNHHRRQHAAIRALVESDGVWPGGSPRYRKAERAAATAAYEVWVMTGRPKIAGWPTPALRSR